MKFERFERRQALDILTADIIRHECAVKRFELRRRRRAAADIALYLVAVLAVIVIVWIA